MLTPPRGRVSQPNEVASERDTQEFPRHGFEVVQQIAKTTNGEMPSPDAFQSVRCSDISRNGISFYRRTPLQYAELVVALGESPRLIYVKARVVHTTKEDSSGYECYRIECQFTGRVEMPDQIITVE